MKRSMVIAFILALFSLGPLLAQPQHDEPGKDDGRPSAPALSRGQRELGQVILDEVSVGNGSLTFRTASGGCTNKESFRINIRKLKGISENSPHFELAVERIARDDCKALLLEGVVIVFDLEKDLGLKGPYTVSVSNPVAPRAAGE
jgi:hypothetical protein